MGRAYEVRKEAIRKSGRAKSKLYSVYAKDLYLAARSGGPNPDSNLNLKRLIEKARQDQVPNDIIKRAIAKVKSGVQENYTNLRYEGFSVGGATIIVDCLTDNVNRTITFVRTAFGKAEAKLGNSGCVSYLYDYLAVVGVSGLTAEIVLEILIDARIEVIDLEDEADLIVIYAEPGEIHALKEALLNYKSDLKFEIDEVTMIPKETVRLKDKELEMFKHLIELLEEIEDVQTIYHNVEGL